MLFSDGVSASMMDINGQVITVDCGDQRNAFLLQRDRQGPSTFALMHSALRFLRIVWIRTCSLADT